MEGRTIRDIELDKVLDIIKGYALSPDGRDSISPDMFTADRKTIEDRYIKIDDYIHLLDEESPLESFPSISGIFDYVSKTHADIPGDDIYKTGEFLHSYFAMLLFLKRDDEIHEEDKKLSEEILSSLSPDGEVNEDHPRLLPLIKAREEIKNQRFRYSSQYISSNKSLIQSSNPVYRNERVVIPIRADQKRSEEVYVMGSSSSGQTLFVEPFELIDLNNKVVLSEERIRAEKLKIKHELSEKVRFLVPVLRKLLAEVVDFDYHYSFALWAKKNRAEHPIVSDNISLINARHPLLGAKAVPITIKLEESTRVLVLSGANAGGKTVTMKTIALLASLNQLCGFIPAAMNSSLPIFDSIFSDIGDGQSIEEAFSTFSSHMANIGYIARKSTGRSLVLLDELGSGTDPEEGSALSVAILGYMAKHSRLTVITSHYGNVKNYAYSNPGMVNASMEFDEKSSKPTYRVLEGIPGDSHAISTAIRAKVPKEITDMAKDMLSDQNESSASIITGLLSKSRTLDRKISLEENKRHELEKKEKELRDKEQELKEKEFELEKVGHKELSSYISSSRRTLEKLIKDISTGDINKEKTRKAKKFIEEISKKDDEVADDIKKKESILEAKSISYEFKLGDEVISKSANTRGKIIDIKGKNRYFVSFENGLRMEVKGSMLIPAKKEKSEVAFFESRIKKAQYVMDVRGKTLAETIEEIEDQLEAAVLTGLSSFSIIHGYGDGILQKGINDYLRTRKEVESLSFARPEDGGMGKTYVKLFL